MSLAYKLSLKLATVFLAICLFQIQNVFTGETREDITDKDSATNVERPTILLSIIARNEEKTLPTYLGYIERLKYPKEKISILIQTDHNEDKTEQRLKEWMKHAKLMYHKIKYNTTSNAQLYGDAKGPNDWSPDRYKHVAKLRQNALNEARAQKTDFLLVIDCDNFILNPNTINALMRQKKIVVAPMIRCFNNETTYSNYWCGMDEQGYYKRTPDYFPILLREKTGCFEVPMIHSTYLVDLREPTTRGLLYFPPPDEYHGEIDDILLFAYSARKSGIKLHLLNEVEYGRMLSPPTEKVSLEDDQVAFVDAKIDWMEKALSRARSNSLLKKSFDKPLISTNLTNHRPPAIDNLGFDEIYMINLARRPDRRKRMLMALEEFGLLANEQDAVDGRTLSKEVLSEIGVEPMRDFHDPYLERPITMGEVGCFLSHWNIWKEIVANQLQYVLVLEDDVRFEPDFKRKMRDLLIEAKDLLWDVKWDLIYIGRKRMSQHEENFVEKSKTLVWAGYSYWTLAYIIRLPGAEKLVAGNPLKQLVPVDEYIPIMFNDHPDTELMSKFPERDLVALSAHPLLAYPTHYVGDNGYVSDTEDTVTVDEADGTAINATENSNVTSPNDGSQGIAERRFAERKVSSRLQGEL